MWRTLLQRVKAATLNQVRKIPPGIRKAIMLKAVRHGLTGLGGLLGDAGWNTGSAWLMSAGVASFASGIVLSVLDAYLVDDKISAARLGSAQQGATDGDHGRSLP